MKKCHNCPHPDFPCISTTTTDCKVTTDQLKEQINNALFNLYTNDYYLIMNRVTEVCISTHFWYYFKLMFSKEYVGYNIDPEYNRNGKVAKYYIAPTDNKRYSAKPDLIIHKRGCNKYNFAYCEFKGFWSKRKAGDENDENKLQAFTSQIEPSSYIDDSHLYQYTHGIKIKLFQEYADITWYSNGEVNSELCYTWYYKK